MIAPTFSREALLHVVKNLPTAPRILAQLGQLLLDPNSDLSDVVELLKHDTGLTARVIRVSNSPVYGAGSRAGSLDEALLRVGFNEVYRLVGLAAVAQMSDDKLHQYGISGVRFRENSLFVAFLVEAMAPNLQLDPRSAYTAGLLRSTGKIAVDRLVTGPSYAKGYSVVGKGRPLDQWEQEVAGVDNATAAGVVLESWRFPEATTAAVRSQYRPSDGGPLGKALNLACGLAETAGFALPAEQSYWKPAAPDLAVDLPEWEIERCVATATSQFERAREAIG